MFFDFLSFAEKYIFPIFAWAHLWKLIYFVGCVRPQMELIGKIFQIVLHLLVNTRMR